MTFLCILTDMNALGFSSQTCFPQHQIVYYFLTYGTLRISGTVQSGLPLLLKGIQSPDQKV